MTSPQVQGSGFRRRVETASSFKLQVPAKGFYFPTKNNNKYTLRADTEQRHTASSEPHSRLDYLPSGPLNRAK